MVINNYLPNWKIIGYFPANRKLTHVYYMAFCVAFQGNPPQQPVALELAKVRLS